MIMLKQKNNNYRLLVVEGNIGAGKSTFLKIINNSLACQIVYEPHTQWQDIQGQGNLLDNFYKDTPRWAYTFQSYAFITRTLAQQKHALSNPHATQVLERSVFSDRHCFAKNLFESGTMSNLEWTLYLEWFSWFLNDHVKKPDGFIYLKTTPQTCHNRLLKRNRKEEEAVPLKYLQQLHDKHEKWLIQKEDVEDYIKNVPVLTLECDKEFEDDPAQQARLMGQINNFFDVSYIQNPTKNMKSSSLPL